MATVRRANVVLQIKDDQVQRYLDSGYCLIDANGEVIASAKPNDEASLRAAYVELTKRVEALEAENARLTAELEKKKVKAEKPVTAKVSKAEE